MIMRGALIGSRRTAIVLVLGLALAGCTTEGDSAGPTPAPSSSTSAPSRGATAPNPQAPAIASSTTSSPGEAIRCLDGEWSFGPVQQREVVTAVSTPTGLGEGTVVTGPPLRTVRSVVADVQGDAPPELTYARLRTLVTDGTPLAPVGSRTAGDNEPWPLSGPGVFVLYQTVTLVTANFSYACDDTTNVGSVTGWKPFTNGVLRCDIAAPGPDSIVIADVRAIACPAT